MKAGMSAIRPCLSCPYNENMLMDLSSSMPLMNNQHPRKLKESKSWGPFWSYQLDSSANPAHFLQKLAKWAELAVPNPKKKLQEGY